MQVLCVFSVVSALLFVLYVLHVMICVFCSGLSWVPWTWAERSEPGRHCWAGTFKAYVQIAFVVEVVGVVRRLKCSVHVGLFDFCTSSIFWVFVRPGDFMCFCSGPRLWVRWDSAGRVEQGFDCWTCTLLCLCLKRKTCDWRALWYLLLVGKVVGIVGFSGQACLLWVSQFH